MNRPLHISLLFLALFFSLTVDAQHLYTVAGGGKSIEDLPPLEISVTPGEVAVG